MGLDKDVDLVVSCPVPVKGTFAEGCDVSHMEAHVLLGVSCLLWRCAVERWFVVWSFRRRQCPGNLSGCDQCRCLYSPDLNNLASNLGRQKGQHLGCGSVVGNPHEVFVDQDGIVVTCLVGGSSMADVRHGDVLSTGPGKPVQ